MCGLVGVAGVIYSKDVDIFNEMLYVDYLRGKDSTGVASVTEVGKVEFRMLKGAYDPVGLQSFKHYTNVVNTNSRVLIGHNRAATRGRVNRHNAHPFVTDDFILAHNGTLDFGCLKDLAPAEGDTDSEQIVQDLQVTGSFEETFAKMSGAWAVSVYDKRDNSINLLRNDKRPLFYTMSESKKTLYWASEIWILKGVLGRNGVKHGTVYELTPNSMVSWILPTSSQVFNTAARTKVEGKEVENFQQSEPWQNWRAPGYGTYNNRQSNVSRTTNGNTSAANKSESSQNKALVPTTGPHNVPPDQEDDDSHWVWYAQGHDDAEAGKTRSECPYNSNTEPLRANKWYEGFDDNKRWANEQKVIDNVKKATQPRVGGGTVVSLEEKRTTIYDTRLGVGSRRINRTQFREMTDHKCGWCENPVTFDDKGHFVETKAHGNLYVCEDCCQSNTTMNEIKEAS